jgi:uncharacterized membrane protein
MPPERVEQFTAGGRSNSVKVNAPPRQFHLLWLLAWTVFGLLLRFTYLTSKSLWTDEFSTIVFSLGNSFLTIPLDQVLDQEQLLQPLKLNPQTGIDSVLKHLFAESNHPPLYFVLAHLWLRLFPATAESLVSAEAARSLPALLGVLSIPAAYVLSWLAFRSRLIAHVAAILTAVSPFGIYLAQEARHYTLSVLWVTASLCCLVIATRTIRDRTPLPLPVCVAWVMFNGLGIATHYFFSLTLGAEAIVIFVMGMVQSWRERGVWHPAAHWQRIWAVVAGTLITGLVWLPMLQEIQDTELTQWIRQGNRSGLVWLEPIAQAAAGWVTMLYLLPIQAISQPIVIASGAILILLVLWTLPKLYRGLRVQSLERNRRLAVWSLAGFVLGAIALFFSVTYLLSTNLTSAFRYNFVYFPAVMVLAGAGLASSWEIASRIAQVAPDRISPILLNLIRTSSRKTVILVSLFSLIGGLTVIYNLGYQKTHRPDIVAQDIQANSQGSALVAIAHQTHGQTGRLMGVALELHHPKNTRDTTHPQNLVETTAPDLDPHFLLAHQTQNPESAAIALRRAIAQMQDPLDLWLINFQEVPEQALTQVLESQNCQDKTKNLYTDGYRYRLYRCKPLKLQSLASSAEKQNFEKNRGR